ncbi:protein tyrosine phosphatase type IVA 2 [Grus japonensis]|uniref:Protein tyrosine phosphatase type IVA 2 n=1 Tax=Grus japonensis TaxID=30415 RepID=A0ABC9XNZ7_GRUJA
MRSQPFRPETAVCSSPFRTELKLTFMERRSLRRHRSAALWDLELPGLEGGGGVDEVWPGQWLKKVLVLLGMLRVTCRKLFFKEIIAILWVIFDFVSMKKGVLLEYTSHIYGDSECEGRLLPGPAQHPG